MIVKTIAILLALALAAIGIQQWRVSHYKARAESLQSVANTLHEANVANQATIVALKAANAEWSDKCAANVATATKAAQDANTYADAQHRAALAAQKALHDAYAAHPDAKAWAGVVVPSSVSRVLTGASKD